MLVIYKNISKQHGIVQSWPHEGTTGSLWPVYHLVVTWADCSGVSVSDLTVYIIFEKCKVNLRKKKKKYKTIEYP